MVLPTSSSVIDLLPPPPPSSWILDFVDLAAFSFFSLCHCFFGMTSEKIFVYPSHIQLVCPARRFAYSIPRRNSRSSTSGKCLPAIRWAAHVVIVHRPDDKPWPQDFLHVSIATRIFCPFALHRAPTPLLSIVSLFGAPKVIHHPHTPFPINPKPISHHG
mgnify:CR=1 FL=1